MKLAILRDVLDRMEVTHAGYQHDMPYIIKTTYSLLKEAQALAHSLMEMEAVDKAYHLQKLHEMLAIMGVNDPSSDTDSMYRTVMACLRGLKQLQDNLDKHVASKESLLHLLGMPKSYSYEPIYEWIRDRLKHEKMASDVISSAKAGVVWMDEKIQPDNFVAEDLKPKLTDDKSQVVFSEWPNRTPQPEIAASAESLAIRHLRGLLDDFSLPVPGTGNIFELAKSVVDLVWSLKNKPVKEGNIGAELDTIKSAMQIHDDLAWTWHCNIAMQIDDEMREEQELHDFPNACASRLMMYLFDRDTTELRKQMHRQKEPTDRDIQRTTPVPQKLGEFLATLQELLDKGVSPDTVVSVFDADLSSYQPVSLACYGDGKLTLNYDDEYDDEIPRWQNAIRNLCISECGQDVDGGGCDSGDPLDLTLTEIQLAFNAVKETSLSAQVPDPGHTIVPADANVSASEEFPVQAGCGAEWDKPVDSLISWHERTPQGDPSEPIYDGSVFGHKNCYTISRVPGKHPSQWSTFCSLPDCCSFGGFKSVNDAKAYCEKLEVDRVKRQQKQS